MKKQYMVYAVAGDIGGAKETKLAIDALQRMMPDVQVKWFVDPSPRAQAGEKVLNPVGISYERRMPSADDRADLLVYGASATAFEAQVEWAKWAGSQNIPAIGVNDFYSTINRHPAPSTVITALDEQDAAITRSVRTDVEVVVVGKPSFAQSVRPLIARKNEIRAEVRSKLDIMDNEFMILVSPGSEVEIFSAHLEAVRQTAEKLQSRKVVFVPRAHPKLLALAEGKQCAEQKVAEQSAKRKTAGYIDGWPPLIRAHAGWGAATPKQLTEQVDDVLFDPVSARKSVETGAVAFQPLIRPGAAERIAQVIADRLLGF